jgi:hypothetical protein
MNRYTFHGIFGAGMIFGMMVLILLSLVSDRRSYLYAQGGGWGQKGDKDEEMLLVATGGVSSNINDLCWVIYKTKWEGEVPKRYQDKPRIVLAVYHANMTRVRLLGTRNITYDLSEINQIGFDNATGGRPYTYSKMEERYFEAKEMLKKSAEAERKKEGPKFKR